MHEIKNRLGKLEVDLARAIKARQVDDDDDLDTLDLENRIKKLEEDFGWLLKAKKAKKSKKAKKVKLTKEAKKKEVKPKEEKKANKAELKAKETMLAELKAKKAKKAKEAKKAMLAELKAKKAKEAMLAEVIQISSDEDPTDFTSIRSRAPIASIFIPQVASTAPRYVLALFAPNALPSSAIRKRKST
uniref:Uncharacterized protein n=1 Tax=Tanacetum cinerariifolium TaxID=118510 RepID=A0A699H518_TANCI|nr:hypothetical protein [Tanacetum cinerariifolium]